ncbi:MAG: hypothetical protein WCG91_03295 [Candidatus Shapirobacteria bacterium]
MIRIEELTPERIQQSNQEFAMLLRGEGGGIPIISWDYSYESTPIDTSLQGNEAFFERLRYVSNLTCDD